MVRLVIVALISSAFLLSVSGFTQTRKEAPQIMRAGVNGIGVPSCAYCPLPEYTAEARAAGIQGTVVVEAVVTADGRAKDISVKKGLGSGLDEKAIEVVKKWRFKPAHDSNDHPVAVVVPMDVTFRLF